MSKVMNVSFSPDYQGCHLKVKATFGTSSLPARVCDFPGTIEFTTGSTVVAIPKEASTPVFNLKANDEIIMTGGTRKSRAIWCFVADRVEKAP